MATQACVLCGDNNPDTNANLLLPCSNHSCCKDCLPDYFITATNNEHFYPPRCCGASLVTEALRNILPEDVRTKFLEKEEEYSVDTRSRIFCRRCIKFLHPDTYKTDDETNIKFVACSADGCSSITCVSCKCLIAGHVKDHQCQEDEAEAIFQQFVKEQGYQTCTMCLSTIELSEACNHMICQCGYGFCYVCGEEWCGLHECPQYGKPVYDLEGYNQDGFHRDTGLNHEGRTRLGQAFEDAPDDEANGEGGDADPDWEVLQFMGVNRAAINLIAPEEREQILMMARSQLLQEQGVPFPNH
ncbi:hypothetical protein P280DRAFT_402830 [Massarina eburnea CBS 473.64]|uniref:RING-type domain-containing protein n=1 Tax=Massarina eburnea CBS 473.64 TaxID=1395130 RepID=A0A6A6RZ84_9PLEO|nr:hypothetical protein P280DRAFT_402830 [Massarina eburnea CBS 473.64]